MSKQGRVLFIDAYDSFSNNIVSLLKTELPVTVEVIKIDDSRFVLNDDAFFNFLDGFDAVVAGPGPGHPARPEDAGLISKLWNLPDDHLIPVLGICFGFQSLALHFGAEIRQLTEPRHGMVTSVSHCGRDMFFDTGSLMATQYHSLYVELGTEKVQHTNKSRFSPSKSTPELIPLAWAVNDGTNGEILMAAKHSYKPFWGVQYHPESICTNSEGHRLLMNLAFEVMFWKFKRGGGLSIPPAPMAAVGSTSNPDQVCDRLSKPYRVKVARTRRFGLQSHMTVLRIMDLMRTVHAEPILFESGKSNGRLVNPETGRFSIIGIHDSSSLHVRYSTASHRMDVVSRDVNVSKQRVLISDVLKFLQVFIKEQRAIYGPPKSPFWGGLMGFVSYEAGLESIDVPSSRTKAEQPDVWFVFVERSIVIDHEENMVYVQSIRENDEAWLSWVENKLHLRPRAAPVPVQAVAKDRNIADGENSRTKVTSVPQGDEYRQKVRHCQDHLRAGSSYELCLTDTTSLHTETNPWQLYLRLRETNPAPFGAYIQLPASTVPEATSTQGISIVSSSPERFLSWSRNGKCQYRPIKGTVKKAPGIDRTKAEEILQNPKERAENLMIVDLIRHDLNGVEGVANVRVPKLMSVEEYETVFQLVSVVEGDLGEASGISVLGASLPPGSMTGAPKIRSCELLNQLENHRARGLYSGVLGYLDVGGGGDFSVVIRTAYKWSGDAEWRVGAGGAVTALSDPEGEWQEMNAKLGSVLRAFD